MATYIKKLDTAVCIKQPDSTGGLSIASPAQFAATAGGSTSTIVSTTLGASTDSDDDFVGYIVECTAATNTENVGLRRRIVEMDDGTSTSTIDLLPAATASGDVFKLYLPPHCIIGDDTGGTTTTVQDARRNEADDFWNGETTAGTSILEVISADAALASSTGRTITDFAESGGVFTLSSAILTTVIGDYFEVWNHPEFFELSVDISQEDIDRGKMRGSMWSPGKAKGLRGASVSGKLAYRGTGGGTYTELHQFMEGLYSDAQGGDLVAGSGSTTSFAWSSGTAVAGRFYLTEDGDVIFLKDDIATPATANPTMRTIPTSTQAVYAMRTYYPRSAVGSAMSVKSHNSDGILTYAWGWVPVATFSGSRGGLLDINLSGEAVDFMQLTKDSAGAITRSWGVRVPTVDPRRISDIRVSIGNTAYTCKSFEITPEPALSAAGNVTAANASDGVRLAEWDLSGTIEAYVDATNKEAIDAFLAGKQESIFIQVGTSTGDPGTLAFYAPVARYDGLPAIAEADGLTTITIPFRAVRHDDEGTYYNFAIGVI